MAPHHRRRLAASRRRVEDEGEDDGSVTGDYEDDSLSEASSHPDDDPDGEGSDFSDNELATSPEAGKNGRVESRQQKEANIPSPQKNLFKAKVSETEAMLNGMTLADNGPEVAEIHFDDTTAENDVNTRSGAKDTPASPAQRKRRDQGENDKDREGDPALVPTRGGFFLHDKRGNRSPNGYRVANNKPKTKPHGLIVDSNIR